MKFLGLGHLTAASRSMFTFGRGKIYKVNLGGKIYFVNLGGKIYKVDLAPPLNRPGTRSVINVIN